MIIPQRGHCQWGCFTAAISDRRGLDLLVAREVSVRTVFSVGPQLQPGGLSQDIQRGDRQWRRAPPGDCSPERTIPVGAAAGSNALVQVGDEAQDRFLVAEAAEPLLAKLREAA